jgi:hypothetical protein
MHVVVAIATNRDETSIAASREALKPPYPRTPSFLARAITVLDTLQSETFWSDGRAKPCDILVGVPIEPAMSNLVTAAFLSSSPSSQHAVRAFLLCTFLRPLVRLYVALRETLFHYRFRLPRGHARTPDISPVPANVDLLIL